MKNKKYLVWIILITILLTGCFGETPITPYEALQRTDLVSLIGRTRKMIYDMYLLTDDQVTILDETTIILPISYRPNDENRRWTMETWQVTLRFVPRSNGEQVLGGYQLNAYYGGPNSLQRAQNGFIASLYAYSQWEEKESDLPRYNGQVSELKNALSEKESVLGRTMHSGKTEVSISIRHVSDNENPYVVTIDYTYHDPLSVTPPEIKLPRVLSENRMSDRRNFLSIVESLLPLAYIGIFLIAGLFVLFRQKIFARKKTARVRLIQLDDGQDINARNFLSIPQGAIYQTRRMSRPATPMNEEFLNTRKLLFALIDDNDRLLTLRARNIGEGQLKTGTIYRVVYKGNQLKKIEQIPSEES